MSVNTVPMTSLLPAPTGLNAHFFGQSVSGGSDFYYWVQALYPDGWSQLSGYVHLGSMPAAFNVLNFALMKWNDMPGAILYNVFRTTTTTAPTLAANLIAQVTKAAHTDKGDTAFNASLVAVPFGGLRFAQARYDFAIDGGGSTSVATNLTNSDTIPINAIMVAVVIQVGTALAGATNLKLGVSAGGSTTTIMASTAIGSVTGIIPGAPTFAVPVKMTAAGVVTFEPTVAVLTAGTIDIFVLYILPPD